MMRKQLLLLTAICLVSYSAFSQQDTVRLRQIAKEKKEIVTDRPPQAVFINFFGYGPIFSAMYDRRFGNRVNGFGFSAGVGYFGADGDNLFSVPLSLNYLIGRDSHFIEVGGGTTYITGTPDVFDSGDSHFLQHLELGYRYQPTRGGFFFRGGYTHLFYAGDNTAFFHLGFGHNF